MNKQAELEQAYWNGFATKCAEYGVDAEKLAQEAGRSKQETRALLEATTGKLNTAAAERKQKPDEALRQLFLEAEHDPELAAALGELARDRVYSKLVMPAAIAGMIPGSAAFGALGGGLGGGLGAGLGYGVARLAHRNKRPADFVFDKQNPMPPWAADVLRLRDTPRSAAGTAIG